MAKSKRKTRKPAKPKDIGHPYSIGHPPWDSNIWSIYVPKAQVWSSMEKDPKTLVKIYGGTPLNFKELHQQGLL